MATYGSGLKIDTKVNQSLAATGTLYTVPAGKYAILNWAIAVAGSGSGKLYIDGIILAAWDTPNEFISSQNSDDGLAQSVGGVIHAGPGAVLSVIITGTAGVSVNGVLLSN